MVKTYRPQNLAEALQIINAEETLLLAGGTDLMVKYRPWNGTVPNFAKPVVFIGHLPELTGIEIKADRMTIGAGTTLAAIINHPDVPDYIKKSLTQMASPPIRNLATLGGNICNSSPAGDSLPMLYALDAVLHLQSQAGTSEVGINEFITGPGLNSRKPDQILTHIEIPLLNIKDCYYRKVGTRKANSISKLSFYAAANYEANHVNWVRIALGAVAPTVVRSPAAEKLMTGVSRDDLIAMAPEIIDIYRDLISPVDDIRSTRLYRQHVALRLLEHYLTRELNLLD